VVSTEGIRGLVEPILASIGLELWDVEVAGDVVRILVERSPDAGGPSDVPGLSGPPPGPPEPSGPSDPSAPGRGIDLDALSDASGVLSPVLDAHPEAVPAGRYQLEVSSPGIERTLRTPGQFRRYIGSEITVKTAEPVAGARRHRGRIVEVGAASIDLQPDADPGALLRLRFDQMNRARTVMEWGPPAGRPTPGRPAAGRQAPGRQPVPGLTSHVHPSKDPAP
jgi:ribosome maturation factor RimP